MGVTKTATICKRHAQEKKEIFERIAMDGMLCIIFVFDVMKFCNYYILYIERVV